MFSSATPAPCDDPEKAVSRTPSPRLKQRLNAEIDTKHTDIILIGCFFCVGLIDSLAFNMYGCFVGMQTGNTIFLALGTAGLPGASAQYSWTKSLVAIFSFAFGALFFSTLFRRFGPLKRWVMISCFLLQAVMVILIAILVTCGVLENTPQTGHIIHSDSLILVQTVDKHFPWRDLAPISILAFQTAGQIVASRVLKLNSMPTVVLTSLYCDLMSDAQLFSAPLHSNVERNRRVARAVCLFVGAVAGSFLSKSWAGFSGALWIAGFLKCCMVFAWFFWKPKLAEA